MRLALSLLRHWLPIAVAATILCGLVYLAAQQALRQYADDPQIQMAEDAAEALSGGQAADSVLPVAKIDVSRSLAPFMIVFDGAGEPVASSGLLHDQIPALPPGVLDYTREHGQDRITWQPEPGVRIATVVVRLEGDPSGFVLVGRSLREIEKRDAQVRSEAGAAWLATLAATLVVVALAEMFFSGADGKG